MSISEPTTADLLRPVAQREANSGKAYSIRSTAPSPLPRLPKTTIRLGDVVLFAIAVFGLWYLSGLVPQDRGYSPLIYQTGLVAATFGIVSNAAWFRRHSKLSDWATGVFLTVALGYVLWKIL
jgi:hypothetical protein